MPFNPAYVLALSAERFQTYRAAAGNDDHAWELYRWNLDLVAAFAPLAADVEVTLRNTMHRQLQRLTGVDDWWTSSQLVFDDVVVDMLTDVVRKHQKNITKGTVGVGRVVADLTLGTWVHLLGRGGHSALGRSLDYDRNLWRPGLRLGFATGSTTPKGRIRRPRREDVEDRVSNLHRLRNRAAHHEPIFNGIRARGTNHLVTLQEVWDGAIELLRWMSPEMAAIHTTSTLATVLAARP
jgi:hypothetical protein